MTKAFSFGVIALLMSACATTVDTPLVFLQSNTAGIDIGTSAAAQGANFVLGYKGSDLAIVPVTFVQNDGTAEPIQATVAGGHSDALSVFGQFSINSNANAAAPKAGLGKFFATGQAAKRLADGFAFKLGKGKEMPGTPGKDCFGATAPPPPPAPPAPPAPAANGGTATNTGTATNSGSAQTSSEKSPNDSSKGTQSLVFGEYTSFGVVVSGSANATDAGFSLGFKDGDVAIIPTISRREDGFGSVLNANAGKDNADAFSVLGQFEADTDNTQGAVGTSLGKFFVTGLAAKTLADGFAAKLCQAYRAPTN